MPGDTSQAPERNDTRAAQAIGQETQPVQSSGRAKLKLIREPDSVELDNEVLSPRGEDDVAMPAYVDWADYYAYMEANWTAGEHLSVVGMTGSGKTVLMRELLPLRDYVVVIATKPQDTSLYGPLVEQGYEIVTDFNPGDIDRPRVIYRPPLKDTSREAEAAQAEGIRRALAGIYQTGGWCVVMDEIRYLSEQLKLTRELNLLWLQGRSLGVTMFAATQRPVSVPLNMFEQASMEMIFRTSGRDDRKRTAEFTGEFSGQVMESVARLPRYEFVMVDKVDSQIMRSRYRGPNV